MDMSSEKNCAVQIQGITAETLIVQIKEIVSDLIPETSTQKQVDPLLTRKQVCALLQVSLVTIHNWTNQGILKPFRIGNKLRFKESEVLAALKPVAVKK